MKSSASAHFQQLYEKMAAFFGRDRYRFFHQRIAGDSRVKRIAYLGAKFAITFYLTRLTTIVLVILSSRQLRFLPNDTLVFYGPTANNQTVLRKLYDAIDTPSWGHPDRRGTLPGIGWRARFVFTQIRQIHHAAQVMATHRNSHPFAAVQMLVSGAALVFYQQTLAHTPPTAIVFANDHSPVSVAMRMAATAHGIKTIYRQHAPISTEFLPLEFDLSIVFDQVTIDRYANIAPITGQTLIWSPFDTINTEMTIPSNIHKIGLCLSQAWEAQPTLQILRDLSRQDGVQEIWLRPHPANNKDLGAICVNPKINMAPHRQPIAAYCDICDVIIVPTSGVALDILHFGVPAIYTAAKTDYDYDGYEFVSEGIIPFIAKEDFGNIASVLPFFDAAWKARLMRFDATIGAPKTTNGLRQAVQDLMVD